MPTRFTIPGQCVLDGNGNGSATITARGDLTVEHTRVTTGPAPGNAKVVKQAAARLYLDGKDFEGTYSGSSDQSDTKYDMAGGETLRCGWAGGDPGATATIYIRGVWH